MTTTDAAPRPRWSRAVVAIAVAVGLLYTALMWSAVDLLVRQATGPLGLNAYGWFVHLAAVVFPAVVFAAALALGARRRAWELALVLLTGLALAAAFWVNIVAYGVVSYSLYGG